MSIIENQINYELKYTITNNAIVYVIERIFNVIDKDFKKSLKIEINQESYLVNYKGYQIVFPSINSNDIEGYLVGDKTPKYFQSEISGLQIPLFYSNNQSCGYSVDNENKILINIDILSVSYIMLTRFEENRNQQKDKFDRFQFTESIACKYNFIDTPIVDEYAYYIKNILSKNGLAFNYQNRFNVIFSHDIDFTRVSQSFKYFTRAVVIAFINEKRLINKFKLVFDLLQSLIITKSDICLKSTQKLVDISNKHGIHSEFYFMAANRSKFNSGYDPGKNYLKKIYQNIVDSKHEIGIHLGFDTYLDKQLMNEEKAKLQNATQLKILKNRQHYLRIQPQVTLLSLDQLAIEVDSTLGYAERIGFRCGTCHPYPFFSTIEDKELTILIRPLLVMDVTLIDYCKFTTDEALIKVNELYIRTKKFDGDFTLLWHNTSLISHPNWTKEFYLKFIKLIKSESGK